MNRSRKLDLTTTLPLAQNPCCVSVGIIKHKCSFENETEIFKNKKEGWDYHIVFKVLINFPSLYKSKNTEPLRFPYVTTYPFRADAEPPLFIPNELRFPPKEKTPSFLRLSALSIQKRGSICGRIAKKATVPTAATIPIIVIGFIDLMIKFTCKYTKNLLVRGLFVFKNFLHRTLLEEVTPIAHNGYLVYLVAVKKYKL